MIRGVKRMQVFDMAAEAFCCPIEKKTSSFWGDYFDVFGGVKSESY